MTRPLASSSGPVTSADWRTSAPADSACLSSRVSSSVRLTVWPWSGIPGRLGNDSSHSARAEHRHPVDPVELGHLVGQPHLLQIADRAGGQAVTARLVARELGLVQDDYLGAGLGGLPCRRRARRPPAGYDQVVSLRHESRLIDQAGGMILPKAAGGLRSANMRSQFGNQSVAARSWQVSGVRAGTVNRVRTSVPVPCRAAKPGVKVDARSERWREHRKKVRSEIVDAAFRAIDRLGPELQLAGDRRRGRHRQAEDLPALHRQVRSVPGDRRAAA